jgi:iron-sulfur cluster repair protein YtfE (RIC family)
MTSFMDLLGVHARLREQLAVHRDFVVGLEFGRALEELEAFERELRAHMDDEERLILPIFRERVGDVRGGNAEMFSLEHRNILRNLETVKEALRRLAATPGAGRRQAHEFLDAEGMLLHLIEHHDLREKNILYPKLDEALTPEERASILSRCEASP